MKLSGYKGQRLNRKDKEMKLRNKKTGEILGLGSFIVQNPNHINCESITKYDSLAELNEEWEDWEEPKEHWYIDWDGKLMSSTDEEGWKAAISIGNYFETKEEAEKAVEKLKAWKRLKDKGFVINDWAVAYNNEIRLFGCYSKAGVKDDLDLLFGGEDE